MSNDDVLSLVERFGRGDGRATAEVRGRVARILAFRGFGMPAEDRLDLAQQVLLELWQAVGRPGFEPHGFWGLVEVVVARRAIDWLRSRRPDQTIEDAGAVPDPRPGPLGDAMSVERAERARLAVERLPESCRELVRLRFAAGKSYREIAELLDTTEGALRVRMHRCIDAARHFLRDGPPSGQKNRRTL